MLFTSILTIIIIIIFININPKNHPHLHNHYHYRHFPLICSLVHLSVNQFIHLPIHLKLLLVFWHQDTPSVSDRSLRHRFPGITHGQHASDISGFLQLPHENLHQSVPSEPGLCGSTGDHGFNVGSPDAPSVLSEFQSS